MNYLNLFLFFLIFTILAFSIPVKQIPKENGAVNVANLNSSNDIPKKLKEPQENSGFNLTDLKQKISSAELEAKTIYVYDLKTGNEIFSKNTGTALPLASLAKLMTAVITKEVLNDEDVVLISEKALAQDGESEFYLNEAWRVKDLIDIMLVSSSNDAAEALSEAIDEKILNAGIKKNTLELMNEKAMKLNMKNTVYFNSTGLDIDERAGAFGSAKDQFLLLNYILKNELEILQKTGEDSFIAYSADRNRRAFHNTNLSLNQFNQIIYSKTGFTDIAGGNLALIFDLGFNHPIVLIILGSSFDGRFKNALKITKIIYDFF